MHIFKKITTLCALSVLAITMTACGSGTADNGDKKAASTSQGEKDGVPIGDGSQTVYLVSKGFQHQFWQAVKEGAEKAGKDYNYKIEFIGPANEQAVTEQLEQLTTALSTNPAAIGFAALDSGAAKDLLEETKTKNIPVVAFDSGVDSDIPIATVSTDNKAAAAEAAKKMAEKLNHEGKVALVCHDDTSQTGKDRCEGFKSYMKENEPKITLVPEQIAGEVGRAADVTSSLLSANSDIKGIYGSNEAAAKGVLQGVKESGKTGKVTIIGFDSGEALIKAIKSGDMAGAITQAPVKMGYETVKTAIKAINKMKVDKKIDSGFAFYTKDNIDKPEIKENLYE